jgi:hypothetical protein
MVILAPGLVGRSRAAARRIAFFPAWGVQVKEHIKAVLGFVQREICEKKPEHKRTTEERVLVESSIALARAYEEYSDGLGEQSSNADRQVLDLLAAYNTVNAQENRAKLDIRAIDLFRRGKGGLYE